MKAGFDFSEKMRLLIETVQDPTLEKLTVNRRLISELGSHCRATEFYRKYQRRIEGALAGIDPVTLYRMMLKKIASAPLRVFAHGTAIFYLPVIDNALNGRLEAQTK